MTPVNSTDMLHGSIEGTIRQPGPARPQGADHTLQAEEAAPGVALERARDGLERESESPLVLYGRLGYIRRDLAHLDGEVHHNPPSAV